MMTKNESLACFAATEVMGWDLKSAAARDFNPAESWADAGMLWEKAARDGLEVRLACIGPLMRWSAGCPGSQTFTRLRVVVTEDSGPAALTESVCRAFGYTGEENAQV